MKHTKKAFSLLPEGLRLECERICRLRLDFPLGLSEIRLRAAGRSSLVLSGENVPLGYQVSEEELSEVISRLCGDSLYAYRDTIREGYIPMEGGGRVGVCGHARYDGDKCVGVSEVSSLAIRVPHEAPDFSRDIYRLFVERGGGMLIYSPPSGGKTTALRSLARLIGSGALAKRVVVIDERCEFDLGDYEAAQVDILRGYRRREGIELALRTLSPEVIVVDEIGSGSEAKAILAFAHCGVPIIASAHAQGLCDILKREALRELVEQRIFSTFFKIRRTVQGCFEIEEEGSEALSLNT